MEYKSISKVCNLEEGMLLGIDQSNDNADMTCLCIGKMKDGVMEIKDIKYIEKQEDIDKYIIKNLAKIYGIFRVSKLE